MRAFLLGLIVAAWTSLATLASAAVTVNDYNWMQIPTGLPTGVTTGVGSPNAGVFNTSGFSGHNTPSSFRWSDLWIPESNLNNNVGIGFNVQGKEDYWSTVKFDQARSVEKIDFKLWANEGTQVRRVRIEGSTNNGASFAPIGLHDFLSFQTGNPQVSNVPVTVGNYTDIRLRFNGTDTNGAGNADYFKGANDGRSGPGTWLFETYGDGTLASDKINWSNKPTFNTVNSNNGLAFNGLNYNDGQLCNSCGLGRAGDDNPWEAGDYAQIDLQQTRLVGKSILDWNDAWWGPNVSIEYSTNGTTYTPVTGSTSVAISGSTAARQVTFDPVLARYFRVTNIGPSGSNSFYIFDEWLTYAPLEGVLQASPPAGSTIMMSGDTGSTLTTPITLQNVGSAGSEIGIIGYTITGPDAALFDLANFSQEILSQNESITYDLEFMATLDGTYTALLTFNTSLGDVTFDLVATVAEIPEPSTLVLLGLGAVGCVVTARRRRQRQSN